MADDNNRGIDPGKIVLRGALLAIGFALGGPIGAAIATAATLGGDDG